MKPQLVCKILIVCENKIMAEFIKLTLHFVSLRLVLILYAKYCLLMKGFMAPAWVTEK